MVEVLNGALAQMEDTVHSLNGYARHAELEPQRLAELDERLSLWVSLARRYKRTPAELPELLASWEAELQKLNAAADLAQLEKNEEQAKAAYLEEAGQVSKARGKAAPKLAKAITQAMQGLGMQGGKFDVALARLEQPAQHGLEQAEFLVAGHSGSTPRPVGKVASGGELSRIALAIAVTTSQLGQAETLIFDEVDSGVGGAVAETVGRLMNKASDAYILPTPTTASPASKTCLMAVCRCLSAWWKPTASKASLSGSTPRRPSSFCAAGAFSPLA